MQVKKKKTCQSDQKRRQDSSSHSQFSWLTVCLIASNLYFLYLSSFSLNVEYYIFPQRMSIKIFFFNYCHRECFPLGKLKFNNFSSANLMIFLFLSWWLSSISSQLEIELNIKWLKENQNTNVPSWKANHIMKL